LARYIQPLFITIDPPHDTNTVMAHYLTCFEPRIVCLVGTPEQIAAVGKNYRVYVAPRDLGRGDVAIDQSSYLYSSLLKAESKTPDRRSSWPRTRR
jgi:protein SCO1/2